MALTQVASGLIASVAASTLTGTQTIPRGTLPTGSVLQVVSTTLTTTFSVSVGGASMSNVTGLSASITPSSSSSKVLVMVNITGARINSGPNENSFAMQVLRTSTPILVGTGNPSGSSAVGAYFMNSGSDSRHSANLSIQGLDSPATTSSTTYQVQIGQKVTSASATVYVNQNPVGGSGYEGVYSASTITLMEIAA